MAEQPSASPPPGSPRSLDGREIELLDGMMPNLWPRARDGDPDAVDRVLKILSLRLSYRRQRIAEED